MSINGLQQQYFANSLDGLTYLDVNGISINGDNIDLTALLPYSGADKSVDLNSQQIKTSYIPLVSSDLTNKLYVDNSITTGGTGTLAIVNLNFVKYTGSISDTDLGIYKISSSAIPTTGINLTNKTYVDAQDALRLPYSGAIANLNLGINNLIANTAQFTAITSATPSLALGVDGSGNLRSFAVNPNLIPLNNTWTGTNSYSNTVSLTSVATATATFTLGLNGSNQIVKYTPSSGIGGSVSAGYVPYASSANTLANSVLFQSGTSVGIGTVSPSALLHIYGSATVGDRNSSLIVSTQRAGLYLASLGAGGTDWNIWSTLTGEGAGAGALAFYNQTNNAYGMVINSAGKIGMGTITPADKLTVQTATENYGVIHTDGTVSVGTYASSTNGGYVGTKSNHKLNFMTNNGVARLTIDTAGNVGIGTQNPAYKLDVQGAMRVRDGDNSRCVYGPNATWGANLIVGSGPEVSGPATAGVISTNGNLHLDGGNSNAIFYGYYANSHGTPNQHLFYGGDYQYNGMPQNSSAYSHVCVLNGDRMFRSQAVAHQVVVYASNSWGPGTNLTYAFYRYNGWTSQMIIGRLSYYVTGNTMAYPTIRIYSQSTGQYWFFQTNNYTNNGYNHITVPIYAIFNEGYTTATGWFDIYVYNNGGANTDTNDILDIHVITLPVSSY